MFSEPEVSLEPINRNNYEAVCALSVTEEQESLLASNIESIVEAAFDPDRVTRAVYLNRNLPVGFLMWGHWCEDNHVGVRICRFMVDARYQRQGIGRRALELAIDEITETKGLDMLNVSYWPCNTISKKLYASFGFVEVGTDESGEVVAEINYQKENMP